MLRAEVRSVPHWYVSVYVRIRTYVRSCMYALRLPPGEWYTRTTVCCARIRYVCVVPPRPACLPARAYLHARLLDNGRTKNDDRTWPTTTTIGTVEYGCVFAIFRSVNSETEPGPNEGSLMAGYYSVPVGCTYNTDWDPQVSEWKIERLEWCNAVQARVRVVSLSRARRLTLWWCMLSL